MKKYWEEVGRVTGTEWEIDGPVECEDVGPSGFRVDGQWGTAEGRLIKWRV